MKSFKQLISEVMEPNTTLPFDYSMRTTSMGFRNMTHIHSYKSVLEHETKTPSNIVTTIYHHVKNNTHNIDFTVNDDHRRPSGVPSDAGLALRTFSVVIGHMTDYLKKNPKLGHLSYLMTQHNEDSYAKSRIYQKLALQHGIHLQIL